MSSRQSRWSPTPEQIMILEEMYQKGLRSPNASQIQMLTAHLSLYGKIEGKNVFYWFQNHKARDKKKLKKRLNKQGHYRYHHHHRLFSGPTVDDELSALHLPRPSSAQPRRLHYSHSSPQFQSCPSSSAGYLLQATVVVEEEEEDAFQLLPTPVNFHPRKMDLPLLQHSDQTPATTTASSSCIMGTTTDGRDCIFTMATGPTLPCCTTHDTHHTPLKTLQLFPTSSTKVKEGHL